MLFDRRAWRALALAALTTFSLAACDRGSGASSAPAPTAGVVAGAAPDAAPVVADKALAASGLVTTRNACDILTRVDAEAGVGQPLPHASTGNIGLGMCDYNAEDFSAGASVTLGSWESIKAAATSGSKQPDSISGVGDEALNLNGSNGSSLYVRKGDEGFLLRLNGPTIDPLPDHGLAAEKILAQKIIDKL